MIRRFLRWWSGCDSQEQPCRSRLQHQRHLRVIDKLNRQWGPK